ncbi:MAG: LamG domain-containing protein, partial [Myxococcales bacterium]
ALTVEATSPVPAAVDGGIIPGAGGSPSVGDAGAGGQGVVDGGGGVGGGFSFDGGMGSGGVGGGISATGGAGIGGRMGSGGVGGRGGLGGKGGGVGGGGVPFPQGSQGLWELDDCSAERSDLRDSSFSNHTAFRSVSAACVPGLGGSGIGIDGADDYVYVPDQPNFTFARGVTAAAWVRPTKLGDVRTIFRKREGGTSTFVLLSNGRDYQFVIKLDNGRAAAVSARATLNTWSHVAGTYDGQQLNLYINGVLAAHARVTGRLSEGAGPLLMGNDAYGRRIEGQFDNVFFDTVAATPAQVARLTCVTRPATLLAVPSAGPAVPAGTTVPYDIQIKNDDSPTCDPRSFVLQAFSQTQGITTNPPFQFLPPTPPGTTAHVNLEVSSTPDVEPDDYTIPLFAMENSPPFSFLQSSVTYSVVGGPCSVRTGRELMVTDLGVVEDPVRTAPGGAWSFGRLMENMAPTPAQAPAMVEKMLRTWLADQTVNGQVIPARPAMQDLVLSSFPRTENGELDLGRAPVRLLAIVNRIDLRDLSKGDAGEGRFVFGVLDPNGRQTQFTLIFEYKVPASTPQDIIDSANRWHALGTVAPAGYNAALQAITDRFTGHNAAPGRVNGSALAQFRTNEIALSDIWQFREFHLSAATGMLEPATLVLTPNLDFNNTSVLADYINANETAIVAEQHVVPEVFAGQPFQTGSVLNDLNGWDAPGVNNPEARQKFSVNTCNGCHSLRETNTGFLQVNPRDLGQPSFLSPFLTGTVVFDFQTGVSRSFNDLRRRNSDLHLLICPNDPLPPPPPPPPGPMGGRGGIGGRSGGVGGSSGGVGGSIGSTGGGSSGGGPTGTGGAIGSMGTGGVAPGAKASVVGTPSSAPVVDESVVKVGPDFVTKGINRAD